MRNDTALSAWKTEFGEEYMLRNHLDPEALRQAEVVYKRIWETANLQNKVTSVLEVGANIGLKLTGVRRLLGANAQLTAIEPNPKAAEKLRQNKELALEQVVEADAYKLPFKDGQFDLVYTSGVLIHIPPERLAEAMKEIVRVSKQFVLCSEYFSHTPMEVPYRNHSGLLWKRDFGRMYLEVAPELKIRSYGFIWEAEFSHFDNLNWWVFEKTSH